MMTVNENSNKFLMIIIILISYNGHLDIVRTLKKAKADVDAKDEVRNQMMMMMIIIILLTILMMMLMMMIVIDVFMLIIDNYDVDYDNVDYDNVDYDHVKMMSMLF